jgi:3D (Asp-Asp-Asp) domain-containing protein
MKSRRRSAGPFWQELPRFYRLPRFRFSGWLTPRIIGRLIILSALVLLLDAAVVEAESPQRLLLDSSKVPSLVRIAEPDGTTEHLTFAPVLIAAVDEAGIKTGDHDLLSLPADLPLAPGQTYELMITRRSEFTLLWSNLSVRTVSEPLSGNDLLSRSGYDDIDLSDGSRVVQPDDDTLVYIAVDKKEFRVAEAIPFSTVYLDDPNLEIGKTAVVTRGQPGQRDLIYEDTYENGVFISRRQTGTEITRDPVQEVISRGTKVVIRPIDRRRVGQTVLKSFDAIRPLLKENGRKNYESFADNGDGTITVDGHTFTYEAVSKRRVTSYDGLEVCLHLGDHSPARNHNTSSGIPAQRGLVATYGKRMDGQVYPTLPLGTIVFVEGYGLGVIADLHTVSSAPNLLDVCYNPGETMKGQALPAGSRTSYILSYP